MVKFNDDELISALLISGFDKVDLYLLKRVKKQLIDSGKFCFEEVQPSSNFLRIVRYSNGFYFPISGSVYDIVYHDKTRSYMVADSLPRNIMLIRYIIDNIDYKSILSDKVHLFIKGNDEKNLEVFSYKELVLLSKYFGTPVGEDILKKLVPPTFLDLNNLTMSELREIISRYYNSSIIDYLKREYVDIIKREGKMDFIESPEESCDASNKDDEEDNDDLYEDCVLIQHYNEIINEAKVRKGGSVV